jgi:hypothetical protein
MKQNVVYRIVIAVAIAVTWGITATSAHASVLIG